MRREKGIIPKECSIIYSFMSWGDIFSIDVSFKLFAASTEDGPYLDILLGQSIGIYITGIKNNQQTPLITRQTIKNGKYL